MDAVTIGLWQCTALIPGISRSGATIVGGLLRGINHEGAAHFSFLIATPIILGATVLEVPKLMHEHVPHGVLLMSAMAAVVAGITALLSTAFLMRYFRQHEFLGAEPVRLLLRGGGGGQPGRAVPAVMALIAWLIVCYAFLYAPIAFLIVFSFNDSRLVTGWSGFSTRWYATLWHDQALIDATLLSLRIAAVSATIACVVGATAGFALARFGRFRGRGLFEAALAAPLVMPEVITGLSLLLLFVTLEQLTGWPAGRGAGTVTLAHASVSVAYVAVVVRAPAGRRGRGVGAGGDGSVCAAVEGVRGDHFAADGAGAGVGLAAGVHLVDG